MLHEVENNSNGKAWCGPTVVASITGRDIARVKALIKKRRGDNDAVKGTYWSDLAYALAHYGYRRREKLYPKTGKAAKGWGRQDLPTLAQWLREKRDPDAYYILDVGRHWVVVHGRKLCDTYTKGKPVFTGSAPHRRRRVREVHVVARG